YLKDHKDFAPYLRHILSVVGFALPRHEQKEGRAYVTLAVGCTGGRHRSVMFANELGEAIRKKGFEVRVYHRDVKGG
ncbi:MAG: RNase adapter RapZ, partial [Vicinamibacteria bacterium]